MPENAAPLPDFTRWPSFPFEGDMRVKDLAPPVAVEPPRSGEDASDCVACNTPDDAYIWENERWRVRAMDRPTGLPMVLILECRSHLDMGDLPNLLAAELGVMTVRLERAIRSLDGVARVHVNRWGDGSAHLHMWFLARPYGRLQLRGTFLSLWDDILPTIPEDQWRENLALVAAWLAEFGGHANTEPAHIQWQSPSTFSAAPSATGPGTEYASASSADPTATTQADSQATEQDAGPDSVNTDSVPAADAGMDSENPDFAGPGGADPMTRSGSDHGGSAGGESAAVAGASGTETSSEASGSPDEERSASTVTDANAESKDVGEHSHGDGVSSSVWVGGAEKGLWRPSDLGDAERQPPGAGAKADPSPVADVTAASTDDGQATVLHGPDADIVGGDGNDAGPASSDRPDFTPRPDSEEPTAALRAGRQG